MQAEDHVLSLVLPEIGSILRAEAARWQEGRLVALTPYTPLPSEWLRPKLRPHLWPAPPAPASRFLKRYTNEAARASCPGCLASCQHGTDKQPLSHRLGRVFEYGPKVGPGSGSMSGWVAATVAKPVVRGTARPGRGNLDGSERNRSQLTKYKVKWPRSVPAFYFHYSR
jgi:hypothetical protein